MRKLLAIGIILAVFSCNSKSGSQNELAEEILHNKDFDIVMDKALAIVNTGFNAGDGYREVWIRDYNTFIELSAEVFPASELKENLLVFFRMQGEDGNIIDGFTPAEQIGEGETDFSYSDLEPRYAGHKNTVETDQETSLVQTVYKYIKVTGDRSILEEEIGGMKLSERLEWAMDFLMENRYSNEYGLIWGATTADWGDVQPEHGWGVDLDENTHRAIDVYDNAMLLIALDNMMEMMPDTKSKWGTIREQIARNTRKHLWDEENKKFIPHIYLEGSPFPEEFNENEIYYFGGTAIAIEAGLLSKEEVKISIDEMVSRVKEAGAPSIGLTLYPPYPEGYFENQIMNPEYSYQNGGDWTWFGGRMIVQLVKYGLVEEAYEQILPMTSRVVENDGFYEWYTIDNRPEGSGTFRGSAGVLFLAINELRNWANSQ
ncbi:GH36-type glycosyl hydrolase domain-containing protein [Echinicola salinicaeni]|uniref:GH36-type glycosyl hydrolase domain-containing protein n=1 Tax=Echinicola salinicaeni TaxID=2762757 RepID=UPI001648BC63|nr:amylo-alpha-1,6-glucosidase [Echinicola salinicaeni]